jgi:hypothetical protein
VAIVVNLLPCTQPGVVRYVVVEPGTLLTQDHTRG